ncbi:MAG: thioredoxin family protein [Chloroflexota bacterium]|nr:thioredoxin family protein [Chloroflexota bacterium]PLS77559.1 MAG: thioredoxin family protein [Chloroflexota bacterium]
MKRYTAVFWIALMFALLTACAQATSAGNAGFGEVANKPEQHSSDGQHVQPSAAPSTPIQPVIATSELVVGPNRMALGLLENNVPIDDAAQMEVKVRYYRLQGEQGTLVGEEAASYYGENLGPRGTFVIYPTFDTAGNWGLELVVQRPGQEPMTLRTSVEVKERASAPKIGDPAPKSNTPTVKDASDLKTITSDAEPDPRFYQMSVADAVTSGKPSLIMFATPGYCSTAVCGPSIEVLGRLKDKFGDQVNAVHVEVYQLPYDQGKTVPAMQEWGLQSEPWLFLVDKDGKIAGRYEGGITFQELEPAVSKLVQP